MSDAESKVKAKLAAAEHKLSLAEQRIKAVNAKEPKVSYFYWLDADCAYTEALFEVNKLRKKLGLMEINHD